MSDFFLFFYLAQVVEMSPSATNNSLSQDYSQPDDQTTRSHDRMILNLQWNNESNHEWNMKQTMGYKNFEYIE